ncbi:MAG: sugar kinase [Osedax symbiont Rs1]|nr:MAG: sugar kinase [Osedax symbiont Rs1]
MLKIFTDVTYLDRRCVEEFDLSEDLLMEHAAMALARQVVALSSAEARLYIYCGPGNNGADGIALARLLSGQLPLSIILPITAQSQQAKKQLNRALKLGVVCTQTRENIAIKPTDIIVDCLFGSGLTRPLDATMIALITQLNSEHCHKISCDIPSGINAQGQLSPIAFNSDFTVTMGALKLALFSDIAKDYVGAIEVAYLGLPQSLYQANTRYYLLQDSDLKLPIRPAHDSHKGTYGHTAVIAGEKKGAAILSSLAAFSMGSGLVSIITNQDFELPLHIMHSNALPKNVKAIAVGMGLGRNFWHSAERRVQLIEILASTCLKLIDADLFYWPEISKYFVQPIVLTPHPKEFCALLKICKIADISVAELQGNRFHYVTEFSRQYPEVVVLLKGCNSIISYRENIYINNFGSAILSKGGSGDILAGLITALLAQGYSPLDAAINGSIILTKAAELCARKMNNYALKPQDLIDQLGNL